jgi:hypothetical protein
VKIATVVITCPGREEQCRATIELLHATDWPRSWPLVICRDEAVEGTRQHRQQMNARRAIYEGVAQDAQFILFLEDDVMF